MDCGAEVRRACASDIADLIESMKINYNRSESRWRSTLYTNATMWIVLLLLLKLWLGHLKWYTHSRKTMPNLTQNNNKKIRRREREKDTALIHCFICLFYLSHMNDAGCCVDGIILECDCVNGLPVRSIYTYNNTHQTPRYKHKSIWSSYADISYIRILKYSDIKYAPATRPKQYFVNIFVWFWEIGRYV